MERAPFSDFRRTQLSHLLPMHKQNASLAQMLVNRNKQMSGEKEAGPEARAFVERRLAILAMSDDHRHSKIRTFAVQIRTSIFQNISFASQIKYANTF